MAIGRTANTANLNLNRVGVKLNPHNDKVNSHSFDHEVARLLEVLMGNQKRQASLIYML